MSTLSKWVLTDKNRCQYLKKISEKKYELIELSECSGKNVNFIVYQDIIDLDNYSKDEIESFIKSCCCCSIENFHAYHKDKSNRFLAKMFFEENSPNQNSFYKEFEQKYDAIRFIENWIKEN